MKTIDTRPRCEFCNKVPRGKAALAGYQRYAPYCSFDHQERGRLASVMRSLPRGVQATAKPGEGWPEGAHFTDMEGGYYDEQGEPLKPAAGVAAVEAPSTKPCPECSGGSPGLVDDGSGGFATCAECGGTGRVPLGVKECECASGYCAREMGVPLRDSRCRTRGVDLPDGAKHG